MSDMWYMWRWICICLSLIVLLEICLIRTPDVVTAHETSTEITSAPANLSHCTTSVMSRISSAYTVNGFSNITLMETLKKPRELFKFSVIPDKVNCTSTSRMEKDRPLIIAVKSQLQGFGRRKIIRHTWGSQKLLKGRDIRVFFIIGASQENTVENLLLAEHLEYGDILMTKVIETYSDVWMKTIAGMQWVSQNCDSQWAYASADDDMVPNLDAVYKAISDHAHRSSVEFPIICNYRFQDRPKPNRGQWGGKNNVSKEVYPLTSYPSFCSGGFYTTSVQVCRILFNLSRTHRYFFNDDVWITGLLRLFAIDSGHLPCSNISDEHCAIIQPKESSVKHAVGSERRMQTFWDKMKDKNT